MAAVVRSRARARAFGLRGCGYRLRYIRRAETEWERLRVLLLMVMGRLIIAGAAAAAGENREPHRVSVRVCRC